MSCLLQHPSIPLYYSESQLGTTKGLVMLPRNCYPHDPRDVSHPSLIVEAQDGFPRSGRCLSDIPLHSSKNPTYQHPEIYSSRDHNEPDGIDIIVKNEPFYPQHNSPVEFFKVEPHFHQNGFQRSPSPSQQFMDEFTARMQSVSPFAAHQSSPNSATEIFSLNLKLDLENYLHAQQGDQFHNFRGQISPASSLSCSSSSLLSIATVGGGGVPSPTRRHSFSSTVVTNAQSLSNLNNHLNLGASGGGGALLGGATTTTSPCYYRQRSHTYSNSSSKPYPYPITRRPAGWNSSILSIQSDLRDHVEGLRMRSMSNMPDDQKEQSDLLMGEEDGRSGSSDASQTTSRKGSVDDTKSFDSQNFLFLGPFGKKRKMVRERQQSNESIEMPSHSMGSDDISLDYVASPTGSDVGTMKDKVEDIVEEDESEEIIDVCDDQSNQPLNLCLGDECETMERVRQLNINCPSGSAPSFPSYSSHMNVNSRSIAMSGIHPSPPSNSVLRNQLLGLTQTLGPTPLQYENQTRDRSASMSAINPRHRITVIQDARVILKTQHPHQSPPLGNQTGVLGQLPAANGLSSLTVNRNDSVGTSEGPTKKILECQDCGKVFSQLRNYRYHRSRHEGTSQFACTCPICFKQFNDKGYLSSHLKIHKNEKEYECEYCKKRFNQRVAYNMHVRIHTGVKPHECHLCEKAFSRKMLLRQHLRTHTGERPYRCDQCGKAFADRSNMLLHQRLHSGLRPFQCSECGKSFSKNHHLKTHLNHHAGIKPYQCSKCKACFSQSSNMKTHFRKCTAVPTEEAPPTVSEESEAPGTSPPRKIESYSQLPHPSTMAPPFGEAGVEYRQPNSYPFSFDEANQPVSSSSPFFGGGEVSRNLFPQKTSSCHQRMVDCGNQEQGQARAFHLGMQQPRVKSSSSLATFSYRQESPVSASAPSTYYFHQSQPDVAAVTSAMRMCGTTPTQGSHHALAKNILVSSPPTASTMSSFELNSMRNRNLQFPNISTPPCGERTSPQQSQRLSPQHLHSPQEEEYRRRSNTWSSPHHRLAGKKRPQ